MLVENVRVRLGQHEHATLTVLRYRRDGSLTFAGAHEEILIRRALQKTKGNRTRAAEILEISHRALLYKIKDYQITDL